MFCFGRVSIILFLVIRLLVVCCQLDLDDHCNMASTVAKTCYILRTSSHCNKQITIVIYKWANNNRFLERHTHRVKKTGENEKKNIRENHVPMIIVHKLSRMTTLWRNKKKKCVKIIMTMMLIIVTYFFWSFLPSHANRRVIVGLWCWRDSDKSNYSLRQLRVFGREGHCCAWFLLFITFTVFFGKISNRWTNHVFLAFFCSATQSIIDYYYYY